MVICASNTLQFTKYNYNLSISKTNRQVPVNLVN